MASRKQPKLNFKTLENYSIARNLKYHRKKKGYTQSELSEKTNVTKRTIQRIENNEVSPHLKTVKLLATALDIEVDDLLELDNPKQETIQKKWLLLLHGTPLLGLTIPFFNILIPLFLWIHKREDNPVYEQHGRKIINFHVTMTILLALALVTLLAVKDYGFYFFILVIPYTIIVTLINIITALNYRKSYYPLAIPFLRSGKSKVVKSATLLAIAILLNLAGLEAVWSQSAGIKQISDLQTEEFAAELDSLRKAHHIPGLAAAVIKDQELIWSEGFGSSHFDVEDGTMFKAVTPDTPFWIASVTKPFLGLLFLQLDEQGKIDLNSHINEMPGWDSFCGWLAQSKIVFGKNLHCDKPITIQNVLNHTVNGEPGTRFFYNPIMYSRLSRYIEYVYGNPASAAEGRHNTMAQLVQENILGPANMERTMAGMWQREKAPVFFDMSQGFEYNNGNYERKRHIERHFAGGAGIVSTVNDLAKYDIALDTGKLASNSTMKKLYTPAVAQNGRSLPYAFGWYVQEYKGENLIWHAGWDEKAGFTALYLKVPERNLTLILLANSEGMWWGNPLDKAEVEKSVFAQSFLNHFIFGPG